jgi:hypothetical protein
MYSNFNKYTLGESPVNWVLDSVQYQVKPINYSVPTDNERFEHTGISEYTKTKKSINDLRAQDYHRFQSNEGFFNAREPTDKSDLWYYRSTGGPALNVQEYQHIILPESQRGGLNTNQMIKQSWNEPGRCNQFDYNTRNNYNPGAGLPDSIGSVYQFDSNYLRSIKTISPREGSMPYPE